MRSNEAELLDLELENVPEVETNLREMERLLRLIGLGRRILREFRRLRLVKARILDVGTGSGWIARMLRDECRRTGVAAEIVALDISPVILACAQRTDPGGITFAAGDATKLTFEDRAFDFVVCATMLHHLSNSDAVKAIHEVDRVGRSWVVCDLRRRPGAFLAAKLLTWCTSNNRMTRHDGPLSFKRAFTPAELASLVADRSDIRCRSWGPLCVALLSARG